jgi:hypothetical protein
MALLSQSASGESQGTLDTRILSHMSVQPPGMTVPTEDWGSTQTFGIGEDELELKRSGSTSMSSAAK